MKIIFPLAPFDTISRFARNHSGRAGFIITLFIFCMPSAYAFDLNHFFQAQFAAQEPRFEEPDLTSVMVRGGMGSTEIRTDHCGVPILFDSSTIFSCSSEEEPFTNSHYKVKQIVLDVAHNFFRRFFVCATLPFYNIQVQESGVRSTYKSVGNLVITAGWTINYEETEELDFIDGTVEVGVITPTPKFPLNVTGIPFRGVAAIGLFDWISVGSSLDLVVFTTGNNGQKR